MYFNAFYKHGYLKVNNENTKEANLDIRTKNTEKKKQPSNKKDSGKTKSENKKDIKE